MRRAVDGLAQDAHVATVGGSHPHRLSTAAFSPEELEITMKTGVRRFFRRSVLPAAAGLVAVVLTACTGHGGGYLPAGPTGSDMFPTTVFTGRASFGFNFSCEDKGGLNRPTGQLRAQLTYIDHGTSALASAPFSIHGTVDPIDPVLESAICIGQNPPPGGNELIFLGRYWLTSPPPPEFPSTCPTREDGTTPLCRFEVIVRDNDGNGTPSSGDFFSIKLSSSTAITTELPLVFYARAGIPEGGNITVN
jgi:hypothetical protein